MPMEGCQAEVVLHFTKWDTPTLIKSQPHLCVRDMPSCESTLKASGFNRDCGWKSSTAPPPIWKESFRAIFFVDRRFSSRFQPRNERLRSMKGDFVHFLNIVMGKVFEESVAGILIWHFENVLRDRKLFTKVSFYSCLTSICIVV